MDNPIGKQNDFEVFILYYGTPGTCIFVFFCAFFAETKCKDIDELKSILLTHTTCILHCLITNRLGGRATGFPWHIAK